MPSLGFLKKKRTKDDLSSPSSSSKHQVPPASPSKLAASSTATKDSTPASLSPSVSRNATTSNITSDTNNLQPALTADAVSTHSNNNASSELTPPTTADSSKNVDAQRHTDSMQSGAYQQQQQQQQPPAFHSQTQAPSQIQQSPYQQQPQSAASIQNIINPTNSDPAHTSNGTSRSPAPGGQPTANPVRETKGKYTLTDFTISRTLGTGSFGRVHLVQSKHNQRFYAVKVLKKAQVVKMKQVEHTNDERRMLQKVKHPFLITLWGTFQDSKNLYMVMDFIEGGELFSLLRKSQVCIIAFVLFTTRPC